MNINGLNQQAKMAVVEQAVGQMARQLEAQVDAEIDRLGNLNDSDIDAIRQKRMKDMKKRQKNMKEWLARGHGEYTEVFTEQEFFKAMKGEERMVCHFFRENWPCKVRGSVCVKIQLTSLNVWESLLTAGDRQAP
jgi:hypothetical protein